MKECGNVDEFVDMDFGLVILLLGEWDVWVFNLGVGGLGFVGIVSNEMVVVLVGLIMLVDDEF